MENNLHQKVINLINSNLEFVKKLKIEQFKDKWLIDAFLKNTILNITVDKIITVDINESINQYVLDFHKNEMAFQSFNEFENFYSSIIKGYSEKTKGLIAKYKGQEYVCDIEVESVDSDRQMGSETIYSVTLIDDDGEEIHVADVSEYPLGAFSAFRTNDDVDINENDIIKYFQDQSFDETEE